MASRERGDAARGENGAPAPNHGLEWASKSRFAAGGRAALTDDSLCRISSQLTAKQQNLKGLTV
jgi:hypothetical protein